MKIREFQMTNNNFKNVRKMKGHSIIFLFLLVIFQGCIKNSTVKDNSLKKDEFVERASLKSIHIEQDPIVDIYMDSINNLKEITDLRGQLSNYYNLKYLVVEDSLNDFGERYFLIQVGYDDSYRFVVLENYYIFPQKGSIYKLNTLYDTLVKVQ